MTTAKHWVTLGRHKYEVFKDASGVVRFPRNRIIDDLVEAARVGNKLDLNMIVTRYHDGKYTYEELKQFYLNIGYSVSGIAELSFFQHQTMRCCCWDKSCDQTQEGKATE